MDGGTEEPSGVWESSIFDLQVIIRAYRFLNSPYTIYLGFVPFRVCNFKMF